LPARPPRTGSLCRSLPAALPIWGRPPPPARAGRGCAGVAVAGEGDGPARGVLRAVRCAPRLAAPLHPEPRGPRGGRARAGPLPVRGLGGDRGRARVGGPPVRG